MSTFINYALQANLALLFFLLMETTFFKGEKSFTTRRLFLLIGMPLALGVPLIKHMFPSLAVESLNFSVTLAPITVGTAVDTNVLSTSKTLEILYFSGIAIFSLLFLKQLIQLFNVLSRPYQKWNGLRVYESANPHPIFSFFWFVSFGNAEKFSSWERTKILRHELVHARQLHSIDILLISMIQILFWFNPLLFFYKRKLIQLHEFEADARSVKNEEVDLYCSLLAKVALQSSGFKLANHFTQPFTLNRIIMMKSMNKKMQLWKIVMTASCTILFLGVMCFYEPVSAQENKIQDQVFDQVDDMPVYPGGFDDMFKAIGKELKYPESARKRGVQGKTLVSFVIEKDGSLTSASIKKGFNKECDKEALRAIQAMNAKWEPGKKDGKIVRTQMVIPIQFKL